MNVYIYDIEVFSDDWIVIFRRPESKQYTVIHNDNYHLREFLSQPDTIIGGFNNKYYDDWVLTTMLNGGSNVEVKKHNDFIINCVNGWEFPFIQGKKRAFKSFDLRDDIADPGISLKAIEGNLKLPIVESSVHFDIDRKLTDDELKEVIKYCKYDVDSTIKLYEARKEDYIDAKKLVAEMYNVPIADALGLTNAKLSAKVLEAKKTARTDERNYIIPDNIDTNYIPTVVLDFFLQIQDKSIPDTKLFGNGKGSKGLTLDVIYKTSVGTCPVTYAWGGLHGAKPCITVEETKDRVIINQDVGSLYPNSMINFGYCSRSMKDPEAYVKLVKKRLGYKHNGDKKRANALKLVVNTVYGAMLNLYNDLADRWAGRSVCISNQLAMTVLIVQLGKQCKTIDFININTDGIMFTIDKSEVELSEQIVAAWCEVTRFEMERDDFKKVIQKDVNNYIGITPDGKMKTKGGYVSLYKGGTFKTNSLQIIHKAIVDYLVEGISPDETINNCTDIFAFQQIVKTGGTYEGSYQYINGKRIPIQKVNRIYAVRADKYNEDRQIVKGKWIREQRRKDRDTGKVISTPVEPPEWSESTIPECPTHAYADNENKLTIDDLDKDYYINMAKNRIDKYINIDRKVENKINKITEVIDIMATSKTTNKPVNIWGKLAQAREDFIKAPVKKSGINRFAEYKYFELADIVPPAIDIFKNLGLVFVVSFTDEYAVGTLVNVDNPDETIEFKSPMRTLDVKGMNAIQALGGVETYQRRYLYMTCLDIVEADAFDATQGKPGSEATDEPTPQTPKKSNKPATPEQREEVKKELIDEDGKATEVQIKSIKNGLKKFRNKEGEDYEPFIAGVVNSTKTGLTKKEAEGLLIVIGEKLNQ